MKAFRNMHGTVVEIDVDVDPNGNPLLPPDTTVDPRPVATEGHYDTVVGNSWVKIPIPVTVYDFSHLKQMALERLCSYKDWYLEQPVKIGEDTYDGDSLARDRLTQALVINRETGYLPPAWIKHDNTPKMLETVDDLKVIISGVQTAFSTRFFEMSTIRGQIMAASNEEELNAITVPSVPMFF